MPSQYELAKHLGITQGRVNQLVKKGCPTDSFEAADLWRNSRALKRAATNRKLSAPNPTVPASTPTGEPRTPVSLPASGDDMLDSVRAMALLKTEAFRLAAEGMANGDVVNLSTLISVNSKAVEAHVSAEAAYRKELEIRKLLVPRSSATDASRRCVEAITRRLMKLPGECGPQCNPQEPLMAMTILEREVAQIVESGRKALEDMDRAVA